MAATVIAADLTQSTTDDRPAVFADLGTFVIGAGAQGIWFRDEQPFAPVLRFANVAGRNWVPPFDDSRIIRHCGWFL